MTRTAQKLVLFALVNGLDPYDMWNMTLAEFAVALEEARRRRCN